MRGQDEEVEIHGRIVSILRETDRDTVPVVAERHGVSEQSIYTWKAPSHRLGPQLSPASIVEI
jgi:hypothetical protein